MRARLEQPQLGAPPAVRLALRLLVAGDGGGVLALRRVHLREVDQRVLAVGRRLAHRGEDVARLGEPARCEGSKMRASGMPSRPEASSSEEAVLAGEPRASQDGRFDKLTRRPFSTQTMPSPLAA